MRFTYELSPRPLDDGPIRIQLDTNQRCSFGTKLKNTLLYASYSPRGRTRTYTPFGTGS